MTVEQLKAAYSSEPFRPFVLHLADGREILVRHREFMMTLPAGRRVIVGQPDGLFNIVDLLHVTDSEFKSIATENGKRRRRPGR